MSRPVTWTPEKLQQLLADYEASGLTQMQFAQRWPLAPRYVTSLLRQARLLRDAGKQ